MTTHNTPQGAQQAGTQPESATNTPKDPTAEGSSQPDTTTATNQPTNEGRSGTKDFAGKAVLAAIAGAFSGLVRAIGEAVRKSWDQDGGFDV
ncbi:hypothetical protein [Streptomyces acidiscabies]|uniref:Uncharacterized protein n=1 Tax=Streptomyces acidiscabies TaxID=42234 RepID=A0ABU4MCZ4_9ACTN|nr:hypothetical protein [Streptomyces acidiscabies]MDX3025392.1 hypothetical protein [Streptomyces acidiscabies]